MKKYIPNLLTLMNLFFGIISILLIIREEFMMASYFFLGSLIFDFLDGFTARLLKIQSEIGKQLDSLADVISFGLAPSFIIYKLMHIALVYGNCNCILIEIPGTNIIIKTLFGFIIALYSALRLAKFNVDTRQTTSFIGLPTPANAILFYSLPLILHFTGHNWFSELINNYNFLLIITIVTSILLISELPLLSLKNLSISENKSLYIIIIISLLLISIFKIMAIPFIILVYIIVSLLDYYLSK